MQGALEALQGNLDQAGEHWAAACRLTDDVWSTAPAAMLWAEAARYLGLDHPVGMERGGMAYEALASVGANTMMDIYSEGLVEPDAAASLVG